jgi:Putative zinc-finger
LTQASRPSTPEPPECSQAFEALPWLVNGSLPAREARELEAHVAGCRRCDQRLAVERELFAALRRPAGNVQQSPLAAWQSFEAALATAPEPAGTVPAATHPPVPAAARPARPEPAAGPAAVVAPPASRRRPHSLRLALTLQAAAIALLSVALLWVLAARVPLAPPAAYRTVAAPDATVDAAGATWRVVFEPSTTTADAVALLASQGLALRAGPSADGVYTVAPRPGAEPRIAALRADRRVRLVEPVGDPRDDILPQEPR